MAKRMIDTRLWRDGYVSDLDPSEKLHWLYLLTNPDTNLCGIYELPIRQQCFDTGFDKDMLLKIYERFERDKKACYFDGWVILFNAIKYQNCENFKIRAGIDKELSKLPPKIMTHAWVMDVLSVYNTIKYNIIKYNIIKCNDEDETNIEIAFECDYFKVSSAKLCEFEKTYPRKNIKKELQKMKLWLDANPNKQKTSYPRFVANWLSKEKEENFNEPQPIPKVR